MTFQHVVIQVVWKNTRLLHLSLALYWRFWKMKTVILPITDSMCFYCLLYTALLSDRWCHWLLTDCWNKWHALYSKTGLWQHYQPTWIELRWTSLHRRNFFLQPFHLIMNLWCKLVLKERTTTNEIKHGLEQRQGGEGGEELLPYESHATASLIYICCQPLL